jgi:hypothetical protein
MEMGKNTIFLSPINFLQVSVTRRKKTGPGGKILYCFSSSSYPKSCQGEKTEGKNIFPQYTACESRKTNCMA